MNIRKSLRIIFRNKIYSLLNIVGLAIGITSAALIFLWVESKVNFNKAIPNSRNIYVGALHYFSASGECETYFETNNPLKKTLDDEFPEVKSCARYNDETLIFIPENTTSSFEEKGAYADSTLFGMIGVKFLRGDMHSVFEPQQAVVLSRSMARKIYGEEDPIGKGLLNEGVIYQVTGVFEDMPRNTSFQFEWLIPFRVEELAQSKNFDLNGWGYSWLQTYVELQPGVDLNQLNEKLKGLAYRKEGGDYNSLHIFLYPLNKRLLYGQFVNGVETGGGYIKTVSLFFLIGILILCIACINFMNLSTARSQKRALEVGVRKTFGTKRKYLIRQFLVESGMITGIALLLSIGLIWLSLPFFNEFIGTQLTFSIFNPTILLGLVAIGLFCTFLAGSYPALFLSSFNPLTTLKMQKVTKTGSAVWIRQGLVVFQFTMAFILICTTLVIYLQIQLAQNRDIGMKKENLVSFPVTTELCNSSSSVRNELINTGLVESCGFSSSPLLKAYLGTNPWYWNGKDPDDDTSVFFNFVSDGLVDAAGIKLIDGTDIDPAKKNSRGSRGVLINETLAKRMGKEGRVGGKLGQSPDNKWEIVGIMKDFVFEDLYAIQPGPVLFSYAPQRTSFLFIRLKPDINRYEAIGRIQTVLRSFTPYHAFEPTFMTDRFDRMFEEEHLVEKLSALFAALAIFISCLGLLGLSAFSAEQRTKEIGVRKVLGAKIIDILFLLGKAYMVLLLISFVIGIPISLYAANHYLKDYAYRITLSWDIFAGVALLITLIALLTVSLQSLKAALANPVKSIKTE
ncbi:hypothetical protein HMPREF1212_01007 [Parabacteroides sp. HGS0025]|jgi:putative ABC transport system permease protein|uniref:ABC transporter permease n=1 Tax=Parabacteroides sp. HGS0025 TaxID=1078087 RepID=UPI0006171F3C|nr:ABC transporter permease [Parabacteroides sp. HGS0025]KKB52850.1 hypothetical protein HMPREF1212_01007 [Parabacteroides sp. HGS0025]